MTINEITLDGLENDAYYFLNPILIKISSVSKFVTIAKIKLTNRSALASNGADLSTQNFELQSNLKGEVFLDLSEYINTICVYPSGYRSNTVNELIPYSLNNINISVSVAYRDGLEDVIFSLDKDFVLGYSEGNKTNVDVVSLNLDESFDNIDFEKINIPYYKYSRDFIRNSSLERYYIENNSVVMRNVSESSISFRDYVRTGNCNDVLVRFLNTKGGYSYFVFENYTSSVKTTVKGDVIKLRDFNNRRILEINRKVENDREYTLTTEVKKRHKLFVENMISSQFLSVLFPNSNNFIEVELTNNSTPSTDDSYFDFSLSFKAIDSKKI